MVTEVEYLSAGREEAIHTASNGSAGNTSIFSSPAAATIAKMVFLTTISLNCIT